MDENWGNEFFERFKEMTDDLNRMKNLQSTKEEYEVIAEIFLQEFNLRFNEMVSDDWLVDGETQISARSPGAGSVAVFTQRFKRIKEVSQK